MASVETAVPPRPLCFDEKWKLSKREQPLRSANKGSSAAAGFPPASSGSSSSSATARHRRCSFTRKCARLVREHRARFYIMRRCVTMLICWRDYSDS